MAMKKLSFPCLLLISFALLITTFCATARSPSSRQGFTAHLIHRDHIHHPGKHPAQRYTDAFRRAFARVQRHFEMNVPIPPSFHLDTVQSEILPDNGEYLLKLSIGTPPFDVYAIADTGSDLFWTHCLPCDRCYPQKKPKYNPKSSSTYRDVACPSQQCHLVDNTVCASPSNTCNYTYGYAGGLTKGILGTETLTFASTMGPPVTLPNVVFGCGRNNTGAFSDTEMGLVGLGKGPVSLISQMGTSFGGRRFSQCLVPFHTPPTITSKMSFGSGSEVSGPGTITTSLVALQDPTCYGVTLYGISVGSTYLPFSSSGASTKGNMFLDSGTPPTIVPRDFYNRLEAEVKRVVKLPPIDDPQLRPQLCYGRDVLAKGPVLTAHFDGKADVELKQTSTFIEAKDGIFCFAMTPTDSPGGIFGNFAQADYLIGFDLDKNTISFKSTDCTKL
ncbi:aspartic proteinase CDR1-like [Rhodamnia argentea]|uniref:Aspartic proteinase CDR1-like n=1 Tax=Rhodamnia argentea TaxID=178133 RepID=A0A8B8PEB3_9MYRT|nr:aspartic proteinase CDR1-like [Rhodamnia argentea]